MFLIRLAEGAHLLSSLHFCLAMSLSRYFNQRHLAVDSTNYDWYPVRVSRVSGLDLVPCDQ